MTTDTSPEASDTIQWLSAGARALTAGTGRRAPAVSLPSDAEERNWRGAVCRLRIVRSSELEGKVRLVGRVERKKSA